MDERMEVQLLERLRLSMSILKITVFPICLPIYFLLLCIFIVKPDFKNITAYKLIVSLGLMDCLYLLQSLISGVSTLFWPRFFDDFEAMENGVFHTLIRIVSCARNGHLLAVPLLSFTLALNRFTVMLGVKALVLGNRCYLAIIGLAWFIYIPLMLILHFSISNITFDFEIDGFIYDAPKYLQFVLGYGGAILESGGFCCTFGIVITILIQKRIYGANFKVSPLEIRLILQSLLICVPLSVIQISAWHGLSTLIPAINLAVYITFNPLARGHMKKALLGRSKTTVVHTISVKSSISRANVSKKY
ncbi:hypothetical protein L596_029324 [Steinernema carpocapsae]|uniref:G-protein coupled receptors family 1 profile domain-containing protein n=1 Tax=Steinernema carpocapsae TaxID=34508 RepID=A0A4U5LUB3_STECR|nr:hypothetical protein L596_029324 [Steinernema carpocapsae]